jgi:hypothetical protein
MTERIGMAPEVLAAGERRAGRIFYGVPMKRIVKKVKDLIPGAIYEDASGALLFKSRENQVTYIHRSGHTWPIRVDDNPDFGPFFPMVLIHDNRREDL